MPHFVAVFCGNTGEAGLGMFSFTKDPVLNLICRQNTKRTKTAREPNKHWENTVGSTELCFQRVSPKRGKTLSWKPGRKTLVQDVIPTLFKRSVNDPLLQKTK